MKILLLQLLAFLTLNLCIAQSGINCSETPVYTNNDFTLNVNSNLNNATCTWQTNGQTIATGTSLTTQIAQPGTYSYSVTCCTEGGGNPTNCEKHPCSGSTVGSERRVSNNVASPGRELYQRYSRAQAYNADETKFVLTGSGTICFNRATGNQFASLPVTSEHTWSEYDPDLIWGVVWSPDGNDRFVLMDINNTGAAITYYSRPGCKLTIGDYEGRVQQDKRVVLRVRCGANDEFVALDLSTIPATTLGTWSNPPAWANWAGFSNDGSLIMVGSGAVDNTFTVFNPNFNAIWSGSIDAPYALQHGDFVTMPNGSNVFIITTDQKTSYINLETQEFGFLSVKQSNSGHISGLASKNCPGLYFASDTYPGQISYLHQLNDDMSVAWSLNIGDISGGRENYEDQTKGTISPCGNYLLYSSPKSGTAEVYEISINNNSCPLVNNNNPQQQCETYVCEVTAIESNINVLPIGCPTENLEAPASWNVSGDIANGETFISWTWTLNGQATNLPDAKDPGFGVVDAGAGYYVGTMTYLDINGQTQTQTCSINVLGDNDCNSTLYVGDPLTSNYHQAGTINSDATIPQNTLVQFIVSIAVNLLSGFTIEQGGQLSIGFEDCDDQTTCPDSRYITHTVSNTTNQSIQLRMETAQNMPLRLSYYPTANPSVIQNPLCEYSFTYGANGNEHVQTITGLNAATEYTIIIQTSTDVAYSYSDCPNMNWEDISCPFQETKHEEYL